MNDLSVASGLPLLGPSPLIEGENTAAYDDLFARIRGVLAPADVLEEIWARDVADLAWEVLRLRRLKAQLMRVSASDGLHEVLDPLLGDKEFCELTKQWPTGDAEARAKVDAVLAKAGLGMDAVMAQTLSEHIDIVERIERLMIAAEARRDGMLRELERRRASLAQGVRRALREAEDAEFTVIAPTEAVA